MASPNKKFMTLADVNSDDFAKWLVSVKGYWSFTDINTTPLVPEGALDDRDQILLEDDNGISYTVEFWQAENELFVEIITDGDVEPIASVIKARWVKQRFFRVGVTDEFYQ